MNPASIMKMMKAKNTFTANHPKFVSFLQYAFGSGIPADSVIEITVTKPGQGSLLRPISGFYSRILSSWRVLRT